MIPRSRLLIGAILSVMLILGGIGIVKSAERRAVHTEETYVASQLENASCLEDWGTNEGAATKHVAITGLTSFGLHVTVSLPYAYRVNIDGETIFADTASEAVYTVTPFDTRRVRGDEIAPC